MRGNPVLTRKYLMTLPRWFHDKIHGGITTIVNQIEKMWAVPGIHMAVKRILVPHVGSYLMQSPNNHKHTSHSTDCKLIMLTCLL